MICPQCSRWTECICKSLAVNRENELMLQVRNFRKEIEKVQEILLPYPGSTLIKQAEVRMKEREQLEDKYQQLRKENKKLRELWAAVQKFKPVYESLRKDMPWDEMNVDKSWQKIVEIYSALNLGKF